MHIYLTARHFDLSDEVREYVERRIVEPLRGHTRLTIPRVEVQLERQAVNGGQVRCHILVELKGHTDLNVSEHGGDAHTAIDLAQERLLPLVLQQEIEELRATVEALETAAEGAGADVPAFRIYGWIDAGVQKAFGDNAMFGAVSPSDSTTFVLGNINLNFDIQPVEKWSALVELRFTTAPDGADFAGTIQGGPYHVTSTIITDPTSPNGGWQKLRWGAIALERA